MKKLLFIALVAASIVAPTQSMERIKSWLGFAKKSNPPTEIANTQICPICLDDLITNPPEQITQLPCHSQHIFHANCINLWKSQQISTHGEATCPYCKKIYTKTLKSDLIPSLYYTASMLAATYHHSLVRDYALDPSKNNNLILGINYLININAANLSTAAFLNHLHHNKEFPAWNARNLAITATMLFAGLKYTETFSIFNNKDATYTTTALSLSPLILGYFAASRLLKLDTHQ